MHEVAWLDVWLSKRIQEKCRVDTRLQKLSVFFLVPVATFSNDCDTLQVDEVVELASMLGRLAFLELQVLDHCRGGSSNVIEKYWKVGHKERAENVLTIENMNPFSVDCFAAAKKLGRTLE